MLTVKNFLTSAVIAVMVVTSLPICAFADEAANVVQEAEVSLVFEQEVQSEEQPALYAAASSGGKWIKESNGRWWYKHADGSYTKYNWEYIDGSWYFFDSNGWMWTEWLEWKGSWYYLNPSGVMHTGWLKDDGKHYYFNSHGVMITGWAKINGADYYFDSDGVMCTGWIKVNNKWYYMNTDGSMRVGWIKLNGNWYYLNTDGSMRTGWIMLENKWYYFNGSGIMLRGWQTIDKSRYYFASDGHMVTESFTEGKRTYTFFSSGRLKSTVMDVKRISQGEHNWCWAAAVAMIGNYENGTNLSMQDVVRAVKGDTLPNEGGSPEEIIEAMEYILPSRGVEMRHEFKYDTFAWYVDKNHPVLVDLLLMVAETKYHTVVCAGYNKGNETLYFIDSDNLVNKQSIVYNELITYHVVKIDSKHKVPIRIENIIIYP